MSVNRSCDDGEIFLYRGRELRLVTLPPEEGSPVAARCRVLLSQDGESMFLRSSGKEDRRGLLLMWYTAMTEDIIHSLVPMWSKKLSVRPRLANVKYAKTRWGSCSQSCALFFNSRLSMLSDEVAEYVVVHELCHIKQMNHSRAFWDEVESALPGSKALRRKLREEERAARL
ncbi:MAG: M48 family metallopeptidase [Synergistaceae bacterium]|jgi:predicted metal-dependent hydrolase|nr:M48 family metallopeptidase [Synergistaceae bacterium]